MARMIIGIAVLAFAFPAFVTAYRSFFGSNCGMPEPAVLSVKRLAMAIENHVIDTGRLPVRLDELLLSNAPDWDGPYAPRGALTDPWGTPLRYRISADAELAFELISLRSDRALGGSGKSADLVFKRQIVRAAAPTP